MNDDPPPPWWALHHTYVCPKSDKIQYQLAQCWQESSCRAYSRCITTATTKSSSRRANTQELNFVVRSSLEKSESAGISFDLLQQFFVRLSSIFPLPTIHFLLLNAILPFSELRFVLITSKGLRRLLASKQNDAQFIILSEKNAL